MKTKQIVAIIIMLVLVVVAVPVGVASSVEPVREKAESSYYYDKTGYAIWEGIENRMDAATNLVKVAEKYKADHTELVPLIEELDRKVKTVENTYERIELAEADRELDAPAQELAEALKNIELSSADQKYPASLIAEMLSEQNKMKHSSYNDDAAAYNSMLNQFPVSMFKTMGMFEPMELYS